MASDVSDDERMRARERPAGRRVMRQIWRHLGFLHWPVARDAIARLLPPGLDVDAFDGAAYVGIVPFTIPLTRTGRLGAPMAPAFHELNLRTYVHRGGRDPGVWFFSLDATSRLAVAGARLAYGLPYFHADITLEETGGGASTTARAAADRRPRSSPATSRRARSRPPRPDRSSSSSPSATCCIRRQDAACARRASTTRRTRCRSRPPSTSSRR